MLYVARPEGDWRSLCGDDHAQAAAAYGVVGPGHVLADTSLRDVLDLAADQEAERMVLGGRWRPTCV